MPLSREQLEQLAQVGRQVEGPSLIEDLRQFKASPPLGLEDRAAAGFAGSIPGLAIRKAEDAGLIDAFGFDQRARQMEDHLGREQRLREAGFIESPSTFGQVVEGLAQTGGLLVGEIPAFFVPGGALIRATRLGTAMAASGAAGMAASMAGTGALFGTAGVTRTALRQANEGYFDIGEILSEGGKETLVGGSFGAAHKIGQGAGLTRTLASVAGEFGTFAGLAPVLHGKTPTAVDAGMALAMVAGFRASNAIFGRGGRRGAPGEIVGERDLVRWKERIPSQDREAIEVLERYAEEIFFEPREAVNPQAVEAVRPLFRQEMTRQLREMYEADPVAFRRELSAERLREVQEEVVRTLDRSRESAQAMARFREEQGVGLEPGRVRQRRVEPGVETERRIPEDAPPRVRRPPQTDAEFLAENLRPRPARPEPAPMRAVREELGLPERDPQAGRIQPGEIDPQALTRAIEVAPKNLKATLRRIQRIVDEPEAAGKNPEARLAKMLEREDVQLLLRQFQVERRSPSSEIRDPELAKLPETVDDLEMLRPAVRTRDGQEVVGEKGQAFLEVRRRAIEGGAEVERVGYKDSRSGKILTFDEANELLLVERNRAKTRQVNPELARSLESSVDSLASRVQARERVRALGFASPNEQSVSFSAKEAYDRLGTQQHKDRARAFQAVDRLVFGGARVTQSDAVGVWTEKNAVVGENSTVASYAGLVTPEKAAVAQAAKGIIGNQLSTGYFVPGEGGPNRLFVFDVKPGLDPVEVSRQVLDSGLGGATVRMLNGRADKVIIGEGETNIQRQVQRISDELGTGEVRIIRGKGEWFGGETREAAKARYESILEAAGQGDLVQRALEVAEREIRVEDRLQRDRDRGVRAGVRGQRDRAAGNEVRELNPDSILREEVIEPSMDPLRFLRPGGAKEWEQLTSEVRLRHDADLRRLESDIASARITMTLADRKGLRAMEVNRRGWKTLAGGLRRKLFQTGLLKWEGMPVRSAADLAVIGQFGARNPFMEQFEWVALKNKVVVGTKVSTSKRPATTQFGEMTAHEQEVLNQAIRMRSRDKVNEITSRYVDRTVNEINAWLDKLGADEVVLMHNHPSGVGNPSRPDVSVHANLTRKLSRLRFQVVLDHGHFGVIDYAYNFERILREDAASLMRRDPNLSEAEARRQASKLLDSQDVIEHELPETRVFRLPPEVTEAGDRNLAFRVFNERFGREFLGRMVNEGGGIDTMLEMVHDRTTLQNREDWITAVYESGRGNITGLQHIPVEQMLKDPARLARNLQREATESFGSARVHLFLDAKSDATGQFTERSSVVQRMRALQDTIEAEGFAQAGIGLMRHDFPQPELRGLQDIRPVRRTDERRAIDDLEAFTRGVQLSDYKIEIGLSETRSRMMETLREGAGRSKKQLEIKTSVDEMVAKAEAGKPWRQWYAQARPVLKLMFGRDEPMFRSILAISSQNAAVKENVSRAFKVYRSTVKQLSEGVRPENITFTNSEIGGLAENTTKAVRDMLTKQVISGQKVGSFFLNLSGQKDAVTIDRWMKQAIFGDKNANLSAADIVNANRLIEETASRLGWSNEQVQAAIWSFELLSSPKKGDRSSAADFGTEILRRAEEVIEMRRELGTLTEKEAIDLADAANRKLQRIPRAFRDPQGFGLDPAATARAADRALSVRANDGGRGKGPGSQLPEDPFVGFVAREEIRDVYTPQLPREEIRPENETHAQRDLTARQDAIEQVTNVRPRRRILVRPGENPRGLEVDVPGRVEPRFQHTSRVIPGNSELIARVMEHVGGGRFARNLERQRRFVMPRAKVQAMAKAMDLKAGEIDGLLGKQGLILPVEFQEALVLQWNRSYARVKELGGEILRAQVEGKPRDQLEADMEAALDSAAKLQLTIMATRSEAGRTLGAGANRGPAEVQRAQRRAVRAFRNIMDETRLDPQTRQRLLREVVRAEGDVQRIARAVEEAYLPTLWDKFIELRTMFLLSGPVTQLRNTGGNAAAAVTRLAETAGGVGADLLYDVVRKPLGLPTEGPSRSPLEITADAYGMWMGVREGGRLAMRALTDEMFAITRGRVGQEALAARRAIRSDPRNAGTTRGAFQDAVGPKIRYPGRWLAAMDLFFSAINRYGEVHKLATRTAINEGLVGPSRARRIQDLVENATSRDFDQLAKLAHDAARGVLSDPVDIIAAKGELAAREFTFRTELSEVAKRVDSVRFMGGVGKIGRLMVPFFPTPLNILKFTGQRAPGLSMLSPRNKLSRIVREDAAREDVVDAYARVLVGGAIFTPFILAAMEGLISGGPPQNKSKRVEMENAGMQFHSVRLGETWWSYRGFSPFSEILAASAEVANAFMEKGEVPAEEKAMKMALSVTSTLLDQPFLTGLSDLIEALTDKRQGERRAQNLLQNFASGTTVPRALSFLARGLDPTARMFPETIADRIKQDLPVLREKTLPFRDPLGRTYESGSALLNAVIRYRDEKPRDEVDAWLAEVQRDQPDRAIVNYPSRTQLGRRTSPEVYDQYLAERGKVLYPMLQRLARDRRVRRLPSDAARQLIDKTERVASEVARYKVIIPAELQELGLEPTDNNRLRLATVLRHMATLYGDPDRSDEERIHILATGRLPPESQ